ncbi:MAG: PAS domain-containing protein [Candidatus Krumholzibacteriota bacterium]|nr:PAS domain-containing protein [Candidatus Krumholzibacteriota bacterium]
MPDSATIFREMFDKMNSGIAIYDAVDDGADFIIRDINDSGLRITNTKKSDVIGRPVSEAFVGVKALGLFDVFRRVWRTGEPEHHPVAAYNDDNVSLWVDNYVYKLPNGRIVAVYDDLTKQKNTERQLNQSMQMSHDLVRFIPSGMFIYLFREPDGFFLLQANAEAEKIAGIDLADWKGRELREIWPGARSAGITGSCLEVIRTGEPYSTEDLRYTGEELTGAYRIKFFLLPENRLAAVYEDVTDKKKAEIELREFNRLLERRVLERTEDLEAFTYSVSHDLRAPLRAINGFAELLRQKHFDLLEENGRHYLENIITASVQMGELIDELLRYSRLGRTSLNMRDIDLGEIIAEAAGNLDSLLSEKKPN